MPKYLLMIVEAETPYAEGGEAQYDEIMDAHRSFSEEVGELGAKILGGEALQPTPTATYLRGTRTGGVTVVDNPSPDVKEILGGYYLIEADDDDHARRVAERCPAQYGYIEVRPIWEFAAGEDA
jgi:hypothetical protein